MHLFPEFVACIHNFKSRFDILSSPLRVAWRRYAGLIRTPSFPIGGNWLGALLLVEPANTSLHTCASIDGQLIKQKYWFDIYYVTINQPEKRNKKVKVRIFDNPVVVSEVPVGLERYLDSVVPAFLSIQPADFPNSHAGRLALAGDEGRLVSELLFWLAFLLQVFLRGLSSPSKGPRK